MNISILHHLQYLIERFNAITDAKTLFTFEERIPLTCWQNQLDRLQAWPPRVQYSEEGSASLDYWLRDSQGVYTHLLWLIGGLERLIDRLLHFSNDSPTDDAKYDSNTQNKRPESQSRSEKELHGILRGISQTTDSLYQMQRAIQRPAPASLLAGISKAHIKSYEGLDKDHVQDKYPHAEQKLIDRLGHATSKRRAILKYRTGERSNAGKNSFGGIRINDLGKSSNSSAVHACPHCHFSITPHQDWAQHVFQDILPYTCLGKDCKSPNKLYASCDLWYSHLTTQHPIEFPRCTAYKCPLCAAKLQDPEAKGHLATHLEAIAVFALPELGQYNTSRPLHAAGQKQSTLNPNPLVGDLTEDSSSAEERSNSDRNDGKLQGKSTEDEIDEIKRILSAHSPFTPRDESVQNSETGISADKIPHQLPVQTSGYHTKPGPQSVECDSQERDSTNLWEAKAEFHGALPATTALNEAAPSLEKPSIQVLECDVCYAVFHGASTAESHSIEEGHSSFVDVTEETLQKAQKSSDKHTSNQSAGDESALSNERKSFRRSLWDDYPETLWDILNPEEILKTQGIHDVIETKIRHAIRRLEEDLYSNHEADLDMTKNLADILREQGKLEEAEKLYWRAFKESRATKGIASPATLNNLRSLAVLLCEKGDHKQAETKLRQVFAGLERINGIGKRNTMDACHDLARTLKFQLGFEEAEMLFRRAWDWRKENLGPNDSGTLSSLQEIAICLQCRGDYSSAETILRDALLVCESTFGNDHFETLKCVFNLSRVVYQQERYSEARSLDKRILKARKKILKNDTELALDEIHNKSIHLRYQGKLRASEQMARRAVDGFERIHGRESEKTLFALNSLGVALRQQGRPYEAVELMTEVAHGLEKIRGRHDFEVQKAFLNLANIWATVGRYHTSERLLARELEPARESQGRDNPLVVAIIINLASSIRSQGRVQPAIRLLEEEIEWLEKLLTERSEHVLKKRVTISKTITQLKSHIEHLSSSLFKLEKP